MPNHNDSFIDLREVISSDDSDTLEYLFKNTDLDPNAKFGDDGDEFPLICFAVMSGSKNVVESLLKHGADFDARVSVSEPDDEFEPMDEVESLLGNPRLDGKNAIELVRTIIDYENNGRRIESELVAKGSMPVSAMSTIHSETFIALQAILPILEAHQRGMVTTGALSASSIGISSKSGDSDKIDEAPTPTPPTNDIQPSVDASKRIEWGMLTGLPLWTIERPESLRYVLYLMSYGIPVVMNKDQLYDVSVSISKPSEEELILTGKGDDSDKKLFRRLSSQIEDVHLTAKPNDAPNRVMAASLLLDKHRLSALESFSGKLELILNGVDLMCQLHLRDGSQLIMDIQASTTLERRISNEMSEDAGFVALMQRPANEMTEEPSFITEEDETLIRVAKIQEQIGEDVKKAKKGALWLAVKSGDYSTYTTLIASHWYLNRLGPEEFHDGLTLLEALATTDSHKFKPFADSTPRYAELCQHLLEQGHSVTKKIAAGTHSGKSIVDLVKAKPQETSALSFLDSGMDKSVINAIRPVILAADLQARDKNECSPTISINAELASKKLLR